MKKISWTNVVIVASLVLILSIMIGTVLTGRKRTVSGGPTPSQAMELREKAFWMGFNNEKPTKDIAANGPDYYIGGAFAVYLNGADEEERREAFGALMMALLPYLTEAERQDIKEAVAGDDVSRRYATLVAALNKQNEVLALLTRALSNEGRMELVLGTKAGAAVPGADK